MFKVSIDSKKCIGCGSCASICEVFEIDEDGKAYVKEKKTDKKCVTEAAESCPVNAIKVDKSN
ncbi:MAG: ferredoxin [Candidatus Pacearchaeota archaeon]